MICLESMEWKEKLNSQLKSIESLKGYKYWKIVGRNRDSNTLSQFCNNFMALTGLYLVLVASKKNCWLTAAAVGRKRALSHQRASDIVYYLGGRTEGWAAILHLIIAKPLLRPDYSFVGNTTMALSQHWRNFCMYLAFVVPSFYDLFSMQFLLPFQNLDYTTCVKELTLV